ncbi:hypothetical protein [uncultured Arenimonas sp.]|uniref:hypothetical protein n=1 Tax=uncultured Arenimonas sp. TaxID=546226 RepID=UPI0030DD9035
MAGVSSKDLLRMAGWPLGIANRPPEEAMPTDEDGNVLALRAAKNIDIDDQGKPRRRPGGELALAAEGLHSLWAHDRFPLMLGVHAGDVVAFDPSEDMEALGASLERPNQPMSYDVLAGNVYASNGWDKLQIRGDGTVRSWAAECPGGQPLAVISPGVGGLRQGKYQVAVTFIDVDGREGGASLPVELELAAGDGITLTNFPVAQDPRTAIMRVYLSHPDSDVLYAVQDLALSTSSYLVGMHTPGGKLDKLFLAPMPAGQIVRAVNGRQIVACGRLLRWSPALTYGLTILHRAFQRYDAELTLVEPAGQAEGSGLFVATAAGDGKRAGRTYYLTGPDPANWQRVIAYPHGAVRGSATQIDASALGLEQSGLVPVWLSDHGQFVIGLRGGQVMELHADRYAAPAHADHASIALREFGGVRHLIATLRGGQVSGMAAVDLAEAEVWKNGERIS